MDVLLVLTLSDTLAVLLRSMMRNATNVFLMQTHLRQSPTERTGLLGTEVKRLVLLALVELFEVGALLLVDHGQDACDGLANTIAAKRRKSALWRRRNERTGSGRDVARKVEEEERRAMLGEREAKGSSWAIEAKQCRRKYGCPHAFSRAIKNSFPHTSMLLRANVMFIATQSGRPLYHRPRKAYSHASQLARGTSNLLHTELEELLLQFIQLLGEVRLGLSLQLVCFDLCLQTSASACAISHSAERHCMTLTISAAVILRIGER